jgi:hypothetical protein
VVINIKARLGPQDQQHADMDVESAIQILSRKMLYLKMKVYAKSPEMAP